MNRSLSQVGFENMKRKMSQGRKWKKKKRKIENEKKMRRWKVRSWKGEK